MLDRPDICRLIATITAVTVMITAGSSAQAQPHRVECPTNAPAEWSPHKPAPLDQVAVLSQPTGKAIDDHSPPSTHPIAVFHKEMSGTTSGLWVTNRVGPTSSIVDIAAPNASCGSTLMV
jgi:hypothetical protein